MLKKIFSSKSILQCVLTACVSYTICTIVISSVNVFVNWHEASYLYYNLQYFAVSSAIAVLMMITDPIIENSAMPLKIVIGILIVALCVFGLGGYVFGWFPFEPLLILAVVGILVTVYFLTFMIVYCVEKKWTDDINKILVERRKEKQNVRQKSN